MSKKLFSALREALSRFDRVDQDPEFYEAKARCRHIARAYGDQEPMFMFHGPRTLLYVHGDEAVNLTA